MKKKISVVIPTYNEEANVVPLSKAIIEVMERDLGNYDTFYRQPFQRQYPGTASGALCQQQKDQGNL